MKFYRASETPVVGSVQVFKQSVISAVIGLLLVGGGEVAMVVGLVRGALPGLLWIGAGFILLMCLLFLGMLRATMGPDNWVLKFDGSQLAFKFRSYLNRHFPADDAVVAVIPASAIESVRKSVETKYDPQSGSTDSGGSNKTTWVSLDFTLKDEMAAMELDEAIREELVREAPRIGISRTKHHHMPMRIVDGRTLRVSWRSPRDHIRPGAAAALRSLGGAIRVEEDTRVKGKDWNAMTPEELEASILELAQSGQRIQAIKLARQTQGGGLKEAKDYVDALMGTPHRG